MDQQTVNSLFEYRDGCLYWKFDHVGVIGGTRAGTMEARGYVRVQYARKRYREHHLVWLMHYGKLPNQLDHINGDPSDNRIENLRDATARQNAMNRSRIGRSGFKGVNKNGTGWKVLVDNKYYGTFEDKYDAATVYNFIAARVFGEYARYNKVKQPWLEGLCQ